MKKDPMIHYLRATSLLYPHVTAVLLINFMTSDQSAKLCRKVILDLSHPMVLLIFPLR